MLVKHFFTGKIAHSSYILAGRKTCAVVDPDRDAEMYIAEARALGVEITHVLLTHLHADFISGHSELAEGCGAAVYVARSAECAFDHIPLSEGDRVTIEDMTVDVLETPGHTPEHLCLVVTDRARSDSPVGVFTGDALFVGDVGRPDLFPGRAEELARKPQPARQADDAAGVLRGLPDPRCGLPVRAVHRVEVDLHRGLRTGMERGPRDRG